MRTIIALCVLAVASADKLGYNYQPVAHSSSGLSFSPGSGGDSAPAPLSTGTYSSSNHAAPAHSQAAPAHSHSASAPSHAAPAASYGTPAHSHAAPALSYGAPAHSYAAPHQSAPTYSSEPAAAAPLDFNNAPAHLPVQAHEPASIPASEFEKEFYTFSAPAEQEDFSNLREQAQTNLKKHLKVIFIKAPESNGLEHAAASLAKHSIEQKTAIYVLHKQADLSELANKLNTESTYNNAKPEVHFVKYRTPDDAARAQQAIQSQYEQLGGSTLSHNGGLAPVLNFASQPASRNAAVHEPQNQYLPASVFRS